MKEGKEEEKGERRKEGEGGWREGERKEEGQERGREGKRREGEEMGAKEGIASRTSHRLHRPLATYPWDMAHTNIHIHPPFQSGPPLILVGWCSISSSPCPPNNIGQEQLTSGRHTHLNK